MSLFNDQLSAAGFQRVTMADIIAALETLWRTAYGQDIDLDPRSPDGQIIGGLAEMFDDLNGIAADLWTSLVNPNAATDWILSSMARLTGIARNPASYSTAPATFVGANGTVVPTTFVGRSTLDQSLWSPTTQITIGAGGTANGTFRCQTIGPPASGTVPAGTITEIVTPITTPGSGLTSITNAVGVPGYLQEGNPNLRIRRQQSVAIASQGMTDGLQAALLTLDGVSQAVVWENQYDSPQAIGIGSVIAANSWYVICRVQDGSASDPAETGSDDDPIANMIFKLKSAGCGTQGDVTKYPVDSQGHAHPISYKLAEQVDVYVRIRVAPRYNYPTDGDQQIATAIAAWAAGTNTDTGKPNIPIGGDTRGNLSWTDVLAAFVNTVHGFDFRDMEFSINGGSTWTANGASVPLDFFQIAAIANISVEHVA